VAVVVRQVAGTEAVVERLRDMGLPTTGDEWSDVGTVAGLASLLGALAGAVIGGILGERWHAKLLARAIDPEVGAEADARREAGRLAAEAQVRNTNAQARVDNASLRHRESTAVTDPVATNGTGLRDGDAANRDVDVDRPPYRGGGDAMTQPDRTTEPTRTPAGTADDDSAVTKRPRLARRTRR
jgi:hypothetical protein